MKRLGIILFALVLVVSLSLVTAVPVAAQVINVPGDDNLTIQEAVDAANPGDTINVAAGIYNEAIVIDKQLTLLGANHGVNPVTETRSDESIIDGTGLVVYHLVDIREASTVFDGFTVQNAPTFGILAQSFTLTITNNNSTIRNNIVSSAGLGIILARVSGITVADNLITNNRDGIYLDAAVYDSMISGNKITGCTKPLEGGITFEYGNDFANIAIENNVIEDNAGSGIYFWYHPDRLTTLTRIEIHCNNIVNNGSGVLNEISTIVDATHNWWGNASGPSGVGPGTGDSVSDNVDYDPWLTAGVVDAKTGTTPPATFDACTEADCMLIVDGDAIVTVACYHDNPGTGFSGDMCKYIDVHIDPTDGVDEVEIRLYYTDDEIEGLDESSLRLYWWDGSDWSRCRPSGVNTTDTNGYSGYIWARIRATGTSPTLDDLTGTPFDGGSVPAPIPEKPVPVRHLVGGAVFPADKVNILKPWIGLAAALILAGVFGVRFAYRKVNR